MRRCRKNCNPLLIFGAGLIIGSFFPAHFVICITLVIVIIIALTAGRY